MPAKPLKLLMLVTDLEIGGTPRVVRDLAVRLRSRDLQVIVTCLAGWGPVAGEIAAAGVRVWPLGGVHPWDLPKVSYRLWKIANTCDVVLSFLMHANVTSAMVSAVTPTTRFFQSIQTTQLHPRWHWPLQRGVGRLAERVVVPTPSVAGVAVEHAGIPAGKISIIPNAIDTSEFATLADRPAVDHCRRVGFVGRLDPVKCVPDLVAAMAFLDASHTLEIFGDGPDRRRITAAIAESPARERITLHGSVASAAGALSGMDLLVLPSEAEGFGLVLIEAMSAGLPVVATDVPGIRDVVRHEQTGLLSPPHDPQSLASAIARLTADRELRDRLRSNALNVVRAEYNWPTVIRRYRQMFGLKT